MRRMWKNEILLIRADDTALWHLEVEGWDSKALKKWLFDPDEKWVDTVLQQCPLLKFTAEFARDLVGERVEAFLVDEGCMASLFGKILGFHRLEVAAANKAIVRSSWG